MESASGSLGERVCGLSRIAVSETLRIRRLNWRLSSDKATDGRCLVRTQT